MDHFSKLGQENINFFKNLENGIKIIDPQHEYNILSTAEYYANKVYSVLPENDFLSDNESRTILALLNVILYGNFSEHILLRKSVGRLLLEPLLKLKYGFPFYSFEAFQQILSSLKAIEKRFPTFFKEFLSSFVVFEYSGMHFPYKNRTKSIFQLEQQIDTEGVDEEIELLSQSPVAIIIPFITSSDSKFKNRLSALELTLNSINQQQHVNCDVFLFINRNIVSQAELKTLATKHRITGIKYSEDNVGAARSRNIWTEELMEKNKYTHFLFLDDDVYLSDPKCIAKLLLTLKSNKDLGAVGPMNIQRNSEYVSIIDKGYEPQWELEYDPELNVLSQDKREGKNWKETFLVEGSCVIYSAETLKEGGGYPEEYNYYYEETLLQSRIKLFQHKINAVIQNSYIYHLQAGGGGTSPHSAYYLLRNCSYYLSDIGLKNKSPHLYHSILQNQLNFLEYLYEKKSGIEKEQMRGRIDEALRDNTLFDKNNIKVTRNADYDISAKVFNCNITD